MTVILDVSNSFRAVSEPSFSLGFNLERLEGWTGDVSARREQIEIEGGHGDFDMPVTRGSRIVRASGYTVARTDEHLGRLEEKLTGTLAGGESGRITVERDGVKKWARGRILEAVPERTFRARGDWELALWCPNPRIYGEMNVASGSSVTVFHRGNFAATSQIVVSGTEPSNYTIYGPEGRYIEVVLDVTFGHPHTIDTLTGELFRDGVLATDAIRHWDPWVIPRNKRVPVSVLSAGGSLSLTTRTPNTFL